MKTLLTLILFLFCLQLQSQDLALLNMKHPIQTPPAPDYFHKTMAIANDPDFKRAGKLLADGGSILITGVVLAVAAGGFAYLVRDDKPEIARSLAIGSGAIFIVCTAIGGAKISKAGSVLRAY